MAKTHLEHLKQAKRIQKELRNSSLFLQEKKHIKVAILGDDSIQHLTQVIFSMLWEEGIYADIYEGCFDGVALDALDPSSSYYQFQGDVTLLLLSSEKVKIRPHLLATKDELEDILTTATTYYQSLWNAIGKNSNRTLLQSNFVLPSEDSLGCLATNYCFSQTSFLQALNLKLREIRPSGVNFVDLEGLSNKIGKEQWFSNSGYRMHKLSFHMEHLPRISSLFVEQIITMYGKIKKCLVLDLDNTLWGGEVGELGATEIQLDPYHPMGESFLAFQKYVKELKERGVILAICSKNEEVVAQSPFLENKNMVLSLDDISIFVANWNDKASNLQSIAKQLNISTDAMVFFDDNPAERHIVSSYLPEVQVIDVPVDPAEFVLPWILPMLFLGVLLPKKI